MTDQDVMIAAIVILGIFGLIVGSFLNVVIHRVPDGQSIVRPRSHCPSCQNEITARDNIPVVSWLVLRAKCRHCGARIPFRYPLVEISTGLVWALLTWWTFDTDRLGLLPLLLVLGAASVALWFIDLDHQRLPDVIVLPLYPVVVVGLVIAGLTSGQWPWVATLVGLAIWLVVIGGLWFFSGGRGMGFGDVKLSPVLGATLGWVSIGSATVGLLLAFVFGAVIGLGLMLARKAGRRSHMPFGPFLLLGSLVGLLAGGAMAQAYLGTL